MKKTITSILALFFLFGVAMAGTPGTPEEKDDKIANSNIKGLSTGFSGLSSSKGNLIYPVWGFYFSGSAGASGVSLKDADDFESTPGFGTSFNVGFFRALSPGLKLMTGLGFDLSSGTLTADIMEGTENRKDEDGDSYIESFKIEDIEDKISPIYLSVPIIFEFGSTSIEKNGLYFDVGARISYMLTDGHSNSGTISTMGYYQQYDVTLGDYTTTPMLPEVPELGFVQNTNIEDFVERTGLDEYEEMASMSNLSISLQAGVGITLPISGGQYLLKTGLVGYYGLTDISGDQLEGKSQYIKNTFAAGPFSARPWYAGIEIALYWNKEMK